MSKSQNTASVITQLLQCIRQSDAVQHAILHTVRVTWGIHLYNGLNIPIYHHVLLIQGIYSISQDIHDLVNSPEQRECAVTARLSYILQVLSAVLSNSGICCVRDGWNVTIVFIFPLQPIFTLILAVERSLGQMGSYIPLSEQSTVRLVL